MKWFRNFRRDEEINSDYLNMVSRKIVANASGTGLAVGIEHVLGNSVESNAGVAAHPSLPLVAYVAEAVVVVLNCVSGQQRAHLVAASSLSEKEKEISVNVQWNSQDRHAGKRFVSVAWSPDGEYLAVGEEGDPATNPRIIVWNYKKRSIVSVLRGHLHSVRQLEFYSSSTLISLAGGGDGMRVWDWKSGSSTVLQQSKSTSFVEAFGVSGDRSMLLACGHGFARYWKIDTNSGTVSDKCFSCQFVKGFSDHMTSISSVAGSDSQFLISSNNSNILHLDRFIHDRWIELPGDEQYTTLETNNSLVCCGSDKGTIRAFDARTMQFKFLVQTDAACVALKFVNGKRKLMCAFLTNNHILIWDYLDVIAIKKIQHLKYPSRSRLQGFQLAHNDGFADFVTFGDGQKVDFWKAQTEPSKPPLIARSIELHRGSVVKTAKTSPDGRCIIAFDQIGNIMVFDLNSWSEVFFREIHDKDVLSFDVFVTHTPTGVKYLIASGGSDCFVHIYEISIENGNVDFAFIQTVSDHSMAVTGVQFAYKNTEPSKDKHNSGFETLQLITSSLDKSITFRNLDFRSETLAFGEPIKSLASSGVTSVQLDASHRYLCSVTEDCKISAYHVASRHQERTYLIEEGSIRLLRKNEIPKDSAKRTAAYLGFDPAGVYVAVSDSPTGPDVGNRSKAVHIFNFFSGKTITGNKFLIAGAGHASVLTSINWLYSCDRLLSTSEEGISIIWKLEDFELVEEFLERLDNLTRKGIVDYNVTTVQDGTLEPITIPENDVSDLAAKPKGRWAERVQNVIPIRPSQEWLETGGMLLSPPSLKFGKNNLRERWNKYSFNLPADEEDERETTPTNFDSELVESCEDLNTEPIVIEPKSPIPDDSVKIVETVTATREEVEITDIQTFDGPAEHLAKPIPAKINPVEEVPENRPSLTNLVRKQDGKQTQGKVSSISYLEQLKKRKVMQKMVNEQEKKSIVERLKNLGIDVKVKKPDVRPHPDSEAPNTEAKTEHTTSISPKSSPNAAAKILRRSKSREQMREKASINLQQLAQGVDESVTYMIDQLVNPVENGEREFLEEFMKDVHQRLTISLASLRYRQ